MENGGPFRLIDVLIKHEVPFVIIGGHAVTYHGYVRATEDTDVVFLRNEASESALYAALTELNACWIGSEIDPETRLECTHPVTPGFIRSRHLMMLVTDYGFLDIFDYIPGLPDEDVAQLFDSAHLGAGRRFVSLEWLRRMKAAADRPKDRMDLENLPEA